MAYTVQIHDLVNLLVITLFFTIEALIHYSIGRSAGKSGFHVTLPSKRDAFKLVCVVLFFAILSSFVSSLIRSVMEAD